MVDVHVTDEMESAYDDAAWDEPIELGGLDMANIRAGLAAVLPIAEREVLQRVYWKLREHASSYRRTAAFRRTYEAWQANRDNARTYQKHVVHEFYAKGIEAAAREVAEMLDEPEHEIEPVSGGER